MAGSVRQWQRQYSENIREVEFDCSGDASNGAIPDTIMDDRSFRHVQGWYLYRIIAVPGATSPTADSDVALNDVHSIDVLGGNGTDLLHSGTAKETYPEIGGVAALHPLTGKLTLDVDNNGAAGNLYKIILQFSRFS